MVSISPVVLGALITNVGVPELARWLASLHAEGKMVTQELAEQKLAEHVSDGDAAGVAFLASHPKG